MFRSMFRVSVAFVFVLALAVSTVPAQALPIGDTGAHSISLDASWLGAALGWMQSLWDGGSGQEEAQSMTAASKGGRPGIGRYIPASGSCIDPMGQPVVPCIDNP